MISKNLTQVSAV